MAGLIVKLIHVESAALAQRLTQHCVYSVVSEFLVDLLWRRGDSKVFKKFCLLKMRGDIGEEVEQEDELCDEVQTVGEFTYLGGRVSACWGCEAAVTAEQYVGGLSPGSVVICCIVKDFV